MSNSPVGIIDASFLQETVDPAFEEDMDLSGQIGPSSASSQSGSTATANMQLVDMKSRAPVQARIPVLA
jgi:hypothetical protein